MNLKDWRKFCAPAGRSKYRVAKDLGVHWVTVHRWESGAHVPSTDQMRAIQTYTGGQVTPNDWVGRHAQ